MLTETFKYLYNLSGVRVGIEHYLEKTHKTKRTPAVRYDFCQLGRFVPFHVVHMKMKARDRINKTKKSATLLPLNEDKRN